MNDRLDELFREIHRKDGAIESLQEENRRLRRELCTLSGKLAAQERAADSQALSLQKLQLQVKRKDRALVQAEKACRARINRASLVRGSPKDAKDERILVLEWIVKEIAQQYHLPYREILALAEIAKENDPSLLALIAPRPAKESDLIKYLDDHGVKSLLDIQIDETAHEAEPPATSGG